MRYTVNVTWTEQNGSTLDQLRGIVNRMQNMAPVLATLPEKVIFPSIEKSFAAGGRPAWVFKGFQSKPPMIKRGLMKRGLTTRDASLNTITVTENSLTFELKPAPYMAASMQGDWGRRKVDRSKPIKRLSELGVFYPAIHQHGGSRHNQNVVLNLQPEDIEKAAEILSNYVATGEVN